MSFNWYNNWPYTPSVMPTMIDHEDVINHEYFEGLHTEIKNIEDTIESISGGWGTVVSKIIAGENIIIDPESGIGDVTISAEAGAPGEGAKPHMIFPAGAATLPNSNFAEISKIEGTNWTFFVAAFDKDTAESMYFFSRVAEGYSGGNLKVTIHARANATSGTAKMIVSIRGAASDEVNDAITTPTVGTVSFDVTALGTAYDVVVGTGTLSENKPAAGDLLQVKVLRNAADGGDDLAVDLEVLTVSIEEV